MTNSTSENPKIVFRISEYTALRAEILQRSETQHQLISIALLATGTFLTLTQYVPATIICAMPILMMFLALGWIQHHVQIRRLGAYIRDRIEPEFLAQDEGWENYLTVLHEGPESHKEKSLTLISAQGIFIASQILFIGIGIYKANLEPSSWELRISFLAAITVTFYTAWRMRSQSHKPLERPGNGLDSREPSPMPLELLANSSATDGV